MANRMKNLQRNLKKHENHKAGMKWIHLTTQNCLNCSQNLQ
jgi:hypothetical protein